MLSRYGSVNAMLPTQMSASPAQGFPQAQRAQASLYTVNMKYEIVDTATLSSAGARFQLSDGASMRASQPNNRHGLSTLTKRSVATMSLPPVPSGVCIASQGMLPLGADGNPTNGMSWSWVLAAYGKTAASGQRAMAYVAEVATAILKQGFFEADLDIPPAEGSGAWAAKSTALHNRLSITRSGTKLTGEAYRINGLINFSCFLAPNAPHKAINALIGLLDAYPNVVSRHAVVNTEGAGPQAAASAAAEATSATQRPMKRPASSTPRASMVLKRPSSA